MSCLLCKEQFDCARHIPIIGKCGHSVCKKCAYSLEPNDSGGKMAFGKFGSCPYCGQTAAFSGLRHNYQMMEVLKDLIRTQKVADKQKAEAKIFVKCHECASEVAEKQARICKTCCSHEDFFDFEDETDVSISDLDKVNDNITCAGCFLDGPHKGHTSLLVLPIKLRSTADKKIGGIRREISAINTSRFEQNMNDLMETVEKFDEPLSKIQEKAELAESTRVLDEVIEKCQKLRDVVKEVESELEDQVQTHLDRLKDVGVKLNDISREFCKKDSDSQDDILDVTPSNIKPPVSLEVESEIVEKEDRKAKVTLFNRSSSLTVYCKISRKDLDCTVKPELELIGIAAGGEFSLELSHSDNLDDAAPTRKRKRPRTIKKSIDIQYETGKPGVSRRIFAGPPSRTLVVPYEIILDV